MHGQHFVCFCWAGGSQHLSFVWFYLQAKPAAKPAPPAPRFEIKKWNAVAMWSWDICADTVSSHIDLLQKGSRNEKDEILLVTDSCHLPPPSFSVLFAVIL